jgi:hypothetical protein
MNLACDATSRQMPPLLSETPVSPTLLPQFAVADPFATRASDVDRQSFGSLGVHDGCGVTPVHSLAAWPGVAATCHPHRATST